MKTDNLGNTGALGPGREEAKWRHYRRKVKVGVEGRSSKFWLKRHKWMMTALIKIRETKRKNQLKGENESHLRCINVACQKELFSGYRPEYMHLKLNQ